jgi:NADH-quinone oxidoreductase subunit E
MDKLEQILEKYRNERGTIIGLLQDINEEYRYLPEDILNTVSEKLEIPLSKLYGLATFYKSFKLEPVGKNHICVCVGTACHINGAEKMVESLKRELNIEEGETTPDNNFSFETVNCLGACALGPLVLVNEEYKSKMDQNKLLKIIKKSKKKTGKE